MWITLLPVLGVGVMALGVWAVLGVLVWAMSVYSVGVQREALETLVDAIRGRLPDVTLQAMDAYVAAPRRYEFWECLGRTPGSPWPLSEKEWQRLREILCDLLRAVEETRDVQSDRRVFAALLAVAPDSRQVAELRKNRCRESEARQRRMHLGGSGPAGSYSAMNAKPPEPTTLRSASRCPAGMSDAEIDRDPHCSCATTAPHRAARSRE
jgi:hypothetical protein